MARQDTAIGAAAITPSDSTDLGSSGESVYEGGVTLGIYVGGAGNVKVNMKNGGAVTFQAVPAGTLLPIQATRVYATGTTATNLIALY